MSPFLIGKSTPTYLHTSAAAGGGPAWNPATDGGMVAWWRSDSLTLTGGSNVASFDDKSGNGHPLSAVNNGLTTVNATAINGHPGVYSDNTSNVIQSRFDRSIPFDKSVFSIGFVFKPNESATRNGTSFPRIVSLLGSGDLVDYSGSRSMSVVAYRAGTPQVFFENGGVITSVTTPGFPFTDDAPLHVLLVGTGTQVLVYYAGVLTDTWTLNAHLGNTDLEVSFGGNHADDSLDAHLGELMITGTSVSVTDWNAYISSYWGL